MIKKDIKFVVRRGKEVNSKKIEKQFDFENVDMKSVWNAMSMMN